MAHNHGTKTSTSTINSVAGAGTVKMMGSAIENMGKAALEKGRPTMMDSMGSMLKMGDGMLESMGNPMNSGVTKSVACGVAMSTGSGAGGSVVRKFLTHPVTLIGLGIALGYLAHKYRKTLVASGDAAE